jgi:hypothetical protein
LTSDSHTLEVLPLPSEGQPPDYNGAVGRFTFAAKASPTNVTAGDPITLQVELAGEGNLDALPFPGGSDWKNFKVYPPTGKVESNDPLGISGVKRFERVVIPQTADIKELPAIAFSFFDPERKAYRTLRSSPIPLVVQASTVAPPQPTILAAPKTEQTPPPTRDIVHIKPHLGLLHTPQPALVRQPWFLALQALPLVAWISALIGRKYREKLENNPRLRRRQQVSETVRKGLKQLVRLGEERDNEAFFAAVFRLLQEQLGERLDLPASAITEAVVEERLHSDAPEDLVTTLRRLFQACNQARYAPHRSSQELQDLVPEVEWALRELRQLPEVARR